MFSFIDIDLKQSPGIDVAEQIRKNAHSNIVFHRLYEFCSRDHQSENPSD